MKTYFVYILKCSDNTYSNNLERGLFEHKSGINKECYTFCRRPLELVFYKTFNDINLAITYEKKIKK